MRSMNHSGRKMLEFTALAVRPPDSSKYLRPLSLLLTLFLIPLTFAQDPPDTFTQTTRYLNPDGDFYLYLNSAQFSERMLEFAGKIEDIAKAANPDAAKQTGQTFEGMRAMFEESGLTSIKGMGMSSVLWKEGIYANRSVAYHGPEPVQARLWQLGAGEPHAFDGLKLMPASTVAGFTGTFRLAQLWTFLTEFLPKLDPNAEEGINSFRGEWQRQGNDLDATMAAFTGEVTIILTMDPEKKRPIDPKIQIPEFGLLAAFTVADDQFYQALIKDLQRAPRAEPIAIGEVEGFTVRDPDRGPIRIQPTVAKSANRVILATNPDLLASALASENRLADSAEFTALRDGLPGHGNQLVFVSKSLTQAVRQIASQALAEQVGPMGNAAVWAEHREQLPKITMHGVPLDGPALLDGVLKKPAAADRPGAKLLAYIDGMRDYQGCIINVHQPDAVVSYSNESVSVPARALVSLGAVSASMIIPTFLIRQRVVRDTQNNPEVLRQQGLGKLRRLGTTIRAIAQEDDKRELPANFTIIPNTGKLPATGEIWDCPGTPLRSFDVAQTDYVYLGATLIDWAPEANRRVIVHSPAGAYEGQWVNFLFLDGHVESKPGADPQAIVEAENWIYGLAEGEKGAVKPPDDYAFRLEDGQVVLLDAADEREIGKTHPSEAFDDQERNISAIAPWANLCWVGTDSGLFRYDAAASSWSRFAIERTHLNVPVDSLTVEGDLLQVGYSGKTASFNLKTRTWQAAVIAPPAEAVPVAAPAPESAPSKIYIPIAIVLIALTCAIVAIRRKA